MAPEEDVLRNGWTRPVAARLGITLIVGAGMLMAPEARGGGPCGLDVDPAGPEVRAAKRWRASGVKALPRILNALCGEDPNLSALALFRLRELGARAIEPMLAAAARPSECLDIDDDGLREDVSAIGELMCSLGEPVIEDPVDCRPVHLKRGPAEVGAGAATIAGWLARAQRTERRAALQAIQAFGRRFDAFVIGGREAGCSDREALNRALLPVLEKRLREERGELRPEVIRAVGALGPAAAPLFSELLPLLEDPALRCDTAGTIGRIGAAASSASSALARLLSNPSTPCRLEVLEALARLGPAAEAVAPAVDAFLADLSRRPCDHPDSLRRAVRALVTLRGAAATGIHHLLSTLDPECPGVPMTEIMLAVRELGTVGPGGDLPLHRLLGSRTASLPDRLLAAEVLQAAGGVLRDDERSLVDALQRKREMWTSPVSSQLPPPSPPPAEGARDAVLQAVALCRNEAGLAPASGPATLPLPTSTAQIEKMWQLARCLDNNPCGPTPEVLRETMEDCCRRSFGSQTPDWCRTGK